ILAISFGGGSAALADPQAAEGNTAAASSAAGDAQSPAPTGNFFSSLKQAFKQDLDREVVRGHFDVDTHRYYCLVDAKTGKGETNGVAGQPFVRSDGMTGIKAGAVSFYSCATVEQQGILVTTGYTFCPVIRSKVASAPAAPASSPTPASSASSASPISSASPAAAPAPSVPREAQAPDVAPAAGNLQTEIMAVYARLIAG